MTCRSCRQNLPLDCFGKRSGGGLSTECKKCSVVRVKKWKQDNPERAAEADKRYAAENREEKNRRTRERFRNVNNPILTDGEKQCYECEQTLPLTDFGPDKKYSDGRVGRCRDCTKAYANNWYNTHNDTPEFNMNKQEISKRAWLKGKLKKFGL